MKSMQQELLTNETPVDRSSLTERSHLQLVARPLAAEGADLAASRSMGAHEEIWSSGSVTRDAQAQHQL
eukprot:scaffold434_cov186-Pinguiococcus_pyrenoidosus.AAC.69